MWTRTTTATAPLPAAGRTVFTGIKRSRVAEEGQVVKAGDPVIKFDLALLEAKAKSVLTPVVISNMDEISNLVKKSGEVVAGQSVVLTLTK